jgi:hypothetical protein
MKKSVPSPVFLEAPAPSFAMADQATLRRSFEGIAYSGDAVSDGWTPIVIDLASVRLPDRCPVLLQHERDRRVGVCSLAVRDGALYASGNLLSNDHAARLAADADEGFPWQLSVHAQPSSVEEVQPGATISVNGRTFSGPLSILRNTQIRELSFTPTGVDAATSARVWSAPNPNDEANSMPDTDTPAAPDQASAIADLEAKLLAATARAEAAETALAAHLRTARLSAVQSTFAQLGRAVTDADAEIYLGLDEATWTRVQGDLLASKPQPAAHLFSEQATGEPADTSGPALNLSSIYAARRGEVI